MAGASTSLRMSGQRLARAAAAAAGPAGAARRSYATAATSSQSGEFSVSSSSKGIKLATLDQGLPTSAITVALKGGARYESQPGLAHVLKNFVFKNTSKRSALRIIRETELLGGVLSSSLTREHLFLTAECMRGDEGYFAEILGDVITQSKFAAHEYHEEVVPNLAIESEQASQNPEVLALDLAHQAAFRRGLGNSLFASPHLHVDLLSAVSYARSVFSDPSKVAVLATGAGGDTLSGLIDELFAGSSASASSATGTATASTSPSKYFGGEIRVAATAHGAGQIGSVVVAFEGGAHNAPEYAVLRALLGGDRPLKWSEGASPLSKLAPLGSPISVKSFNLHYSDAGLLGFFVQAPTETVGELAKKAVQALKDVAAGVKDEDLKRAIAKTKFLAANTLESRVARQELIGAQLLESGSITSIQSAFEATDKVTAKQVQDAAKAALKSRPTLIAVGDTHKLPYADELGV